MFDFATRPVVKCQYLVSIIGRQLHGSSFKLLYGSIGLTAIIDNYKKSQKPKTYMFWETLTSNKKRPSSTKNPNRIIYPSTFASSFNQISRVESQKFDFIKKKLGIICKCAKFNRNRRGDSQTIS